jgi:hypothetical protein
MEDKKYIEIFNKYYKNAVDIEGIKFKLIGINNPGVGNALINEQLVFRMSNNDDLSYNKISLLELLLEKIQKFNRLFSLGNFGFDQIEIENAEEVHIGKGDNVGELISGVFERTNKLVTYKYYSTDHRQEVIDMYMVKHISFTYEMTGDFIRFVNKVRPLKGYVVSFKTKQPLEGLDLEDAEYLYQEGFRGSYEETEINYLDMDMIEFPQRFVDSQFQSTYVYTEFI